MRKDVDWSIIEREEATSGGATAGTLPAEGETIAMKEKKVRRNKNKDVYVERKKKPKAGEEAVEEEVIPEPEPEIAKEDLVGDDAYPYLTIGLIG